MIKKINIALVILFLLAIILPFSVNASILSEVKSKTVDGVVTEIDEITTEAVDAVREIAITIAVLIIIVMAITWKFGKSDQALALMKASALVLVISFICIFFTEQIVGIFYALANRR